MAHFSELNSDNRVINCIVIDNFNILDTNGTESEAIGIEKAKEITGSTNEWVQTSYNNNFRKQYAGIGYTYDSTKDKFISPQPYPSWSLDSNDDWQPPVAYPTDGEIYSWNEDNLQWDLTS